MSGERSTWTGVALTKEDQKLYLLANGQYVKWEGRPLLPDRKVTLYDVQTHSFNSNYILVEDQGTNMIYIPEDEETNLFAFKEVAAGIGGIGEAASFIGLQILAFMDILPMACSTLMANGRGLALQGDILSAADRHRFHECHGAPRCLLMSGFPCQPLSRQGDQKGQNDPRTEVFHALVKTAWEQQAAGLILECVPAALKASRIQNELQKLGASLGLDLIQRVLNLHVTWPCRRTREWCVVIPNKYQIAELNAMPSLPQLNAVQALFPHWPLWPQDIDDELTLNQEELAVFGDNVFGDDVGHLRRNEPAPCLLHSYGSVLQACPCGCRGPFSKLRLLRDGVRGYYVVGRNGKARFLHVAEQLFFAPSDQA